MLHSHIPKMADTSRATVRHTTLETACKLALALGVRAETSSRTMRAKASTNGIVPPSPASESNMNATDDRTE